MKIFFGVPSRGEKLYGSLYQKIYKAIEVLGYKHLDSSILEKKNDDHYKKLEEGGQEALQELYDREIMHLKTADVNVFECSVPSLGIGYQVEKSIEFNKPTIVLYQKEHVPHFLAGIKDDKLIIRSVTEKNILEILRSCFLEAKKRADKRFNFFISPYLLSYLNKVSKEQGTTKSMFIRSLILDHMKKA